MAIEMKIRYYVRCDDCTACLRPNSPAPAGQDNPVLTFPEPLRAIHRALEQHWSVRATCIYCPTCGRERDSKPKEN